MLIYGNLLNVLVCAFVHKFYDYMYVKFDCYSNFSLQVIKQNTYKILSFKRSRWPNGQVQT
jgi:hypothetical protein